MQICQKHWNRLREAIDKKGMGHLVSQNGEILQRRLEKEIKNELAVFDPLMQANMMITQAAIQDAGIEIMMQDENGNHKCPLCECDRQKSGLAENWIEGCTDECLDYCKKNNLVSFN